MVTRFKRRGLTQYTLDSSACIIFLAFTNIQILYVNKNVILCFMATRFKRRGLTQYTLDSSAFIIFLSFTNIQILHVNKNVIL